MVSQVDRITCNLYDQDFFLWIQETVQKLKDHKFDEIDLPNLVEEVESMGRSEKRELKSRLTVLLMHLLKWKYQPERRSESWRSTVSEQRICLEALLEDSPSLKPFLLEIFQDCYQKARVQAFNETQLKLNIFPEASPFNVEETLSQRLADD